MIALSEKRIGNSGLLMVGDMRSLPALDSNSAAAVINCFAEHHLDMAGIRMAMLEWNRVLVQNGCLLGAAWEGTGAIDYEKTLISLNSHIPAIT